MSTSGNPPPGHCSPEICCPDLSFFQNISKVRARARLNNDEIRTATVNERKTPPTRSKPKLPGYSHRWALRWLLVRVAEDTSAISLQRLTSARWPQISGILLSAALAK
jgi:hypothetical protein